MSDRAEAYAVGTVGEKAEDEMEIAAVSAIVDIPFWTIDAAICAFVCVGVFGNDNGDGDDDEADDDVILVGVWNGVGE